MRTELVLIGLLALSGVALFFHSTTTETQALQAEQPKNLKKEYFQQYQQWKATYNKNTNASEDKYRFNQWIENLTFVTKHNQKDSKLTLGLNQFADLSNEEFRSIYTSEITKSEAPVVELQDAAMNSVNWVQKGAVTDVKNQGVCGSCWAFSTVAGLEGLMQITTGTLENLSEQQLTSCVPFPFSLGCNGGNPFFGYIYTAMQGIESAQDYPYVQQNNAKTATCEYDASKVVFQNKGVQAVEANQPTQMGAALQNQPLSVAVDAASIYFQLYNGGVLSNSNCGTELNHAITLVAYDADGDYWTVKNSWGTSWGNSGYANIANQEGDGVCGINMSVTYPTA